MTAARAPITIPVAAWDLAPAEPRAARLCLVELWRHASGEPPVSTATTTSLTAAIGYSRRSVTQGLKALQEHALCVPPSRGRSGWRLLDPDKDTPFSLRDGERVVPFAVAEKLRRRLGGMQRALTRSMDDAKRLAKHGETASVRYRRRTALIIADTLHSVECTLTPETCALCAEAARRAQTGAIGSDADEAGELLDEARLYRRAARAVNAAVRLGGRPEGKMLRRHALEIMGLITEGDHERARRGLAQIEARL